MPVKIDGKTFESHDEAVAHLKKSKPEISDPDAYVATVERQEKGAKLKSRLAGIGHDNATRGATDEEQKKIDEARKKKNKINSRGTASDKHMSNGIEYAKSLKARLQKLGVLEYECEDCGASFSTKEKLDAHYENKHE